MSADGLPESSLIRTVHVERRVDCEPYRVYRAWSSPEALSEWFPVRVEGSLAPGTRSTLVFPDQRIWWDVVEAQPYTRFQFRRPWLANDEWVSTTTVTITPSGYGSLLTVEDGPFDLRRPYFADAYAESLSGWAAALANLRSLLDFSVDLRRDR